MATFETLQKYNLLNHLHEIHSSLEYVLLQMIIDPTTVMHDTSWYLLTLNIHISLYVSLHLL